MKEDKEYCSRLSKGLVVSLFKFKDVVKKKLINHIHLQKDLDFTHSEYTNFQKLRYHGLVEQTLESGYWALTYKGLLFCCDNLEIPIRVYHKNNETVQVSHELTTARKVLADTNSAHWDKIDDYRSIVFNSRPSENNGEQLKLF